MNYDNEFELNDSFDKDVSIFKQIKVSNFKRKYLKIIKFLESKGINSNDMQYRRKIFTKNSENALYPDLTCFFPNHIKDQNNIFLLSFFCKKKVTNDFYKRVCELYFFNLDNLFMIIFFDKNLKPFLFFRKEDEEKTSLLKVDGKDIKEFF